MEPPHVGCYKIEIMNCPKCQTSNPDHSLFCSRCGAELPEASPAEAPSLGNQPTLRDEAEPLSVGELPTMREAKSRRFKAGEKLMGRYRVVGELGHPTGVAMLPPVATATVGFAVFWQLVPLHNSTPIVPSPERIHWCQI